MASETDRTACIECDLLLTLPSLQPGENATCPRCGHVISTCREDGISRSLALAISALVLLALSNSFPFMALEAQGLEKVMTLPRTAIELHEDGYAVLAALVLGVIVIVPALILLTIVAICVPILQRRPARWLVPGGRLLFLLGPWSMAEVFIIGVIVSLVKIVHLAHVELGIAFWSYTSFVVCFTATLASLDRLTMWREIERLQT
ncbi:MAG: paraquat-inducible protein A [Myxococcota bacterium]